MDTTEQVQLLSEQYDAVQSEISELHYALQQIPEQLQELFEERRHIARHLDTLGVDTSEWHITYRTED